MTTPVILAATWSDGVLAYADGAQWHELAGRSVRGLAPDQAGNALAIVDGHALCRRRRDGEWSAIASSDLDLACVLSVGDTIYLGTNDARVLRIDRGGGIERLDGFERVAGRGTWYAGSATIDGRVVGPPLGVRSMTATADRAALLVNVHVGGIPRSTDGGASWHPTIRVDSDVHEVRAHPADPRMVVAASAAGLCISRDGGATWTIEQHGLHASYCSAVAFFGSDVIVSASVDHFATRGAVYRRPIDGGGSLQRVGGLPQWLDGIVDSGCIATLGSAVAIVDKGGTLYASTDGGTTWLHRDRGLPMVSGLLLI